MPVPSRWLRLLCFERGAVVWVPGLWLAAALILFALLQAATERAFYNHTQDLKVALGPLDVGTLGAPQALAFETGLRQRLAAQRELTLVGAEPVRIRAETVLGTPLPPDARRWMRATRNLNVSFFISARAESDARGVHGQAELWQVADESCIGTFAATASDAAQAGRALGESVGVALFSPRPHRLAAR